VTVDVTLTAFRFCQDSVVESTEVTSAIDATISIATGLGLPTDRAIVLQNSNKLALRLLPCNVFARVSTMEDRHALFEVKLAKQLAATDSPVAALYRRVEPRGYERDGFEVTLWMFYETVPTEISPISYAKAIQRLHLGMRGIDIPTPHFTDRVASAEQLVANRDLTPELTDEDRQLLASTLQELQLAIRAYHAIEQLLHGEPHPGNVLNTSNGPMFIDLETCCRGPIEFDLAHVPRAVSAQYPAVNQELLNDCRQLVLAMVAVWRWERGDQFPNGIAFGRELLSALRTGPPWPTIDELPESITT
jgi:aminoglycoside phosphotransferase (APT) family kinase protein